MRLNFIFPTALWLILLLPLLWALTLAVPRRLARWRFWSSLALRTTALLALMLALAGTQLVQPVGAVTTVFLLDGSDSVSLSQRARAETFIERALADMPPDDRAAVVVFGQRALVERTPSPDRGFGQIIAQPGGGATDIQAAVQLGLALLPGEGHQRLVLLSDGGQNLGDAEAAARLAAARGVPIDVLPLSGLADGLDAQVAGVEMPAAAREGQALRMRVELESSQAASGRLVIQGPDGQTLAEQAVDLPAGPQRFDVVLPPPAPYFNRYVVRLEVEGDARPENNAAEAYTFVSGQPRVLLVEGQDRAAENLAAALRAARVEATVVAPGALPASLGELSAFDAVVLVDVPRRAVTERAQSALAAYVHDLGRGLMMVGGPQSFGAGGWRDTPIEQALPVEMDIPTQYRLPPVSIVVLIDVSGSMAQEEGGRTKISLAAEGAQRIAALMRDEDDLTVIPFDSDPAGVVGPLPGSRREEAIDALSQMQPGGGGIEIHDGLLEAEKYIRMSDKPVRHVITITDGGDTVQQEGALAIVERLRGEKVTLTSIAVGDGPHVPFIRDAARVGGGRTFLTEQAASIPSILTDEAQAVIQPYVIEETFTPARIAEHPVLRELTGAPPLDGYVLTSPKQTAQVLLAAPDGQPVLAAWQYGLGRALAWTSDMRGQWAGQWVAWDQFPRLSAQMLAWLVPPPNVANLSLQASTVGDELVLTAQAQNELGGARSGLDVAGRLLGGDGGSVEVTLREVGPGQYRAVVAGARPGAYLVQLVASDQAGQPFGSVTAGAVVPRSAEYRTRGANPGLMESIARGTGGRVDLQPDAAFDANELSRGAVREVGLPLLWLALLLLPLDVGLRRLLVRPEHLAPLLGRLRLGRLAPAGQSAPAARAEPPPAAPVAAAPHKPRPAPAEQQPKVAPDLERLREAQERARKRARGEE